MFGWLKRRQEKDDGQDEPPFWQAPMFRGLKKGDRKLIEERLVRRSLAAGETLIAEGEPAHDVFVVVSGTFAVVRGSDTVLHEASEGDTVGESALFEGLPRRATVRCTADGEVIALPLRELHQLASGDVRVARLYQQIVLNLAERLDAKLQSQTEAFIEGTRAREQMGSFVVNLLILLCGYVFLLSALQSFGSGYLANTSMVSIPIQIVFGIGSWHFIRSTGKPLAEFGLGFRHLVGSLVEAAVLTPVVLLIITGLKQLWLWARDDPGPLIAYPNAIARLTSEEVVPLLVVYALASFVQELIVRGALQSSLESFLHGEQRKTKAIVVSGLLFSVTHLHMSFLFAALVLLPGMFWGWLFARRRNLLGVTLSHVAVGAYVFFVLGITL